MNLGIQLGIQLTIKLTLECSICLQSWSPKNIEVAAVFLGATRYAVCNCCGQSVEDIDAEYMKRYDARFYQRRELGSGVRVFAHVG
jgi:hypothetical protein